jgi:ABC-type transport system involved in cytochrome c biogenesis permease subunit
MSAGTCLLQSLSTHELHPSVIAFTALGEMYRASDSARFNEVLSSYREWLSNTAPASLPKARAEFVFNASEPFYQSLVMYVVVFLLVFVSWLVWPQILNRSAFMVLVVAFAVHTTGLIARMVLQGRPPVTNLYSSAIFVGWMAVLLGLILEHLYRNGVGSLVAATIGFITLIIAHHLASSGDTLEMMRAVLDSNFWLATHVVCITVGYSSTFLSGFLAIIAIFRRRLDRAWDDKLALSLDRMVYGILCFSTFFSFLGTILGGIWADQSWGRFWGWDPKENGALMIVLWNSMCLHIRTAKMVTRSQFMVLMVFGNIVTAFSWFGVNMLGIGLHSYGFMDKAFNWLVVFAVTQLLIMALGLSSGSARDG